jgi:hypothetical protein
MRSVVSEDSVRRALKAIELPGSEIWMREALMDSVRDALNRPWVLDMDATIKPLYGHQEGAEVGYNPHKPGRPSHVLHTFWIGNLRLVLDAVLTSGKQHSSGHAKAPLKRLLEELGERKPALVRGDCGYGNQDIIEICEEHGLPFLLRLRQTANVKRLIVRLFRREDWSRASDASQGWQAIEDSIRLSGWSKARRVVVLRRRIKQDIAMTAKRDDGQLVLALPHESLECNAKLWEYTVLVTNAEYDIAGIGQLYRDRCDCENGFDELKNQWGWGGFTTRDMHRSQITARAVALVYNWWSWYVRAANPQVGVYDFRVASEQRLFHFDHRLLGVAARPVGVLLVGKVGFEDRLQRQHRCCHADPIAQGRDAQRPEFAVGLRYEHSSDGVRSVRLFLERKRQFTKPPLHAVRLDIREVLAVHARCALVGAALGPCMSQNIVAADLVVQRVEAEARLCLRFRVQRHLQLLNTDRS